MKQNIHLFTLCIFINLLIGNIVLIIIFPGLMSIYHILISLFIFITYGIVFYKLNNSSKKYGNWKLAGISAGLSLSSLFIACICTSIGNRLSTDGIISAGLKGAIPMFIFAIVLASPFWLPLALFNFTCLYFMKHEI
ncbi:hypothetical protein QWZ06_16755 [Chryseobacterium tructae]|uniref:MotA/TolQ/ExbB proton channel domain-containing protein n=1 Tax=Chryseobacterium tructae TaxID=1037380 RepID=A0ABV7Y213_9FLAO|nr:hypothetical protein [Chryseobacterium tructae]MDN3693823.1 hypothetical protein [Chryseobacterium tructae]